MDDYLNAPTDHRPEAEPWSAGRCRVFLSHLADQRAVADQMTSVLDWWGIDGFVAHKGPAFSSGQRKQLLELLTRLESAESLTGPTIERAFDLAKVRRALKAEVGALGQILA